MLKQQLLVFTDLDGSLLDHYDYSHAAADAMLSRLASMQIPVIPVSSKTAAELRHLREELHNVCPFIVENGAAVYIPQNYFESPPADSVSAGEFRVKEFTRQRTHWQSLLHELAPAYASSYTSFEQAGTEGIMQMTGLDRAAAERAAQREYGEPLLWNGSDSDLESFIATLENGGARVLRGGRFLHVGGDCDKGSALRWLVDCYRFAMPGQSFITLAIGDSENDRAMLQAAELALVIPNPVQGVMQLDDHGQCFHANMQGPVGWAEGVGRVLQFLQDSEKAFNHKHKVH